VGVEAAKAEGMMPEHSPLPPEACRGPRVDDQRRTVPMSAQIGASRALGSWPVLGLPEMEVAQSNNGCLGTSPQFSRFKKHARDMFGHVRPARTAARTPVYCRVSCRTAYV
jgi:hypothetical protein